MKTKMYSLFSYHDLRHIKWVNCCPMLNRIVGKPPHFVLWPTAISHPVVTTYPPSCLLTIMYQFLFYIGGWVVGPPLQKVPFICLHKILKAANNISPHNSLASVNYFIIILPRKNEKCLSLTACCVSVSHERYWQALCGLRGLLNDGCHWHALASEELLY